MTTLINRTIVRPGIAAVLADINAQIRTDKKHLRIVWIHQQAERRNIRQSRGAAAVRWLPGGCFAVTALVDMRVRRHGLQRRIHRIDQVRIRRMKVILDTDPVRGSTLFHAVVPLDVSALELR